jgi:hypothetical protein
MPYELVVMIMISLSLFSALVDQTKCLCLKATPHGSWLFVMVKLARHVKPSSHKQQASLQMRKRTDGPKIIIRETMSRRGSSSFWPLTSVCVTPPCISLKTDYPQLGSSPHQSSARTELIWSMRQGWSCIEVHTL